jgi:hypothetical protein
MKLQYLRKLEGMLTELISAQDSVTHANERRAYL